MAAQLWAHFTPSGKIRPLLLHHFTTLGSPTLTSFNPIWIIYPPHSYTSLTPPLAAQLLHHFIPSVQITPSLLHHFPTLAAQLLHHFTPSEQITHSLLHQFPPWQPNSYIILLLWTHNPLTLTPLYPLGSPTLTSFYPLWTNYPPHSYTSLTPPPWQPNSYIILSPLYKLHLHSYTILTLPSPLAAQLWSHFTPSGKIRPLLLHHFTTLGSPTLTSFNPVWTN